MNLEFFNRENSQTSTSPTVNITAAGNIRINKAAVKLMQLKPGDYIQLAQNKDDGQWYAVPCDDKEGFKLREYKGADVLQFNAIAVAKSCFESYQANKSGASLTALVSATPTKHNNLELWPLLMKRKVGRL